MLHRSGDSAKGLKEKVISPHGTTEAGINTLVKHDFEKTIFKCIKAARDRSIELGK
jgi:pyrroline-5-carboxylate reductase